MNGRWGEKTAEVEKMKLYKLGDDGGSTYEIYK